MIAATVSEGHTYTDNKISAIPLSSYGKTLEYISEERKMYLKNGSNVLGTVDCNDFIKDGMLSSAELCGNILVLTFNTDAGKTPISVNLSSFVDNYDAKIQALSNAISTIGEDYLDSNDKLEIYNDILSPDEVRLYKGPGDKDISLSVGTGTQLCVYTATLSDFYLVSETSSAIEIQNSFTQTNNNISNLSSTLTSDYLKKDGSTSMTGSLNMNGQNIQNVNTITANWYNISTSIQSETSASEILVKNNNLIQSRTPSQIRNDIDAQQASTLSVVNMTIVFEDDTIATLKLLTEK